MTSPRTLLIFVGCFMAAVRVNSQTTLEIQEGPVGAEFVIKDGVYELTVDSGVDLKIACKVDGDYLNSVLWLATGEGTTMISFGPNLLVTDTNKYSIEQVQTDNGADFVLGLYNVTDGNRYSCQHGELVEMRIYVRSGVYLELLQGRGHMTERNSQVRVNSQTTLEIQEGPVGAEFVIKDGVYELTVDSGVDLKIACKVDGDDLNPVLWLATGEGTTIISFGPNLLVTDTNKYSIEQVETDNGADFVLGLYNVTDENRYSCQHGELVEMRIYVRSGVYLELLQGRGHMTERNSLGNYDLKVFPGETITLMCAPAIVQGVYQWRREPSTILYSSANGVQVPEDDPLNDRFKFDPQHPCRWDEVWRMTIRDLTEEDSAALYSCYNDSYGQATVNLTVSFAADETAEITFNDDADLSEDNTKVTLRFNECNFDPSRGKWESFGDFCYQLGVNELTFDEAEAKCQEYGASLTSVHSNDEKDYIRGMMSASATSNSWIGVTDREEDRTFLNIDGTPFDFESWSFFEPNSAGGNCVKVDANDWYDWFDVSCTERHRYICKSAKGDGNTSMSSMSMSCYIYGEHPSATVTWFKDGQLLTGPSYRMEEIEPGRVHKLTILTGMASSGEYRCVAENDARNGSLIIDVQVAVNVTTEEDSHISYGVDGTDNTLSAGRGQTITLTCHLPHDTMPPSTTTLLWRKTLYGEEESTYMTSTSRSGLSLYIEWSMTLLDISEEDQAIYSCEMLDGPSGHLFGSSTVYVTVFDAPEDVFDILLTEHTRGAVRKLKEEDSSMFVDESVGNVTFTCRTSFWADSLIWKQDGRTLGGKYGSDEHKVVEIVPGWEVTLTFEFKGSIFSDGMYTCEASSGGRRQERTFEVVVVVNMNIALTGGRGHEIQLPQNRVITVIRGETVSLTCFMQYPSIDIQYLRWEIDTGTGYADTYSSPEYSVEYYHRAYGRISFHEDRALGESTLTLTNASDEDESVYICKILFDGDEDRIQLVVVDESNTCENECYPGSGAWDGNCREASDVCNGEKNCDNLQDEADCPDVGCPGLVAPSNGELEATSFTYGSEVTYFCADGYDLHGNSATRRCQDNGEWTGSAPTCEKITIDGCPRLLKPENGLHFDIGNGIGISNYFRCLAGYELQGSPKRTCQDDGSWSGEIAVCHLSEGDMNAQPKCRLARGNGITVEYPMNRNTETIQYRTVMTVDRNVGSITIACRFPRTTVAPYWLANNNGFNEPPGPLIGDHSVSETMQPGLEWSLTMGVSKEGPLQAGDQFKLRCVSSEVGTAYVRIDVRGDLPWATTNTTHVSASLTKGKGVETIIRYDNGSSLSHIQVTAGSKISLKCSVTTLESMASEHISASWKKKETWGDSTFTDSQSYYADDSRISITKDLDKLQWTLSIRKVAESDSGLLFCNVILDNMLMFNDEGMIANVNLTVLPVPTTPMPTTTLPSTTIKPTTMNPTESAFTASVRVTLKNGEGDEGSIVDLVDAVGTTRDINVLPDQTISLVCKVSNIGSFSPSDMLVTWQRLDANGVITVTSGSKRIFRDRKIRIKEDLDKLKWTLTIKEITSEYQGVWNCLVKPRTHVEERNIISTVVNLGIKGESDTVECYECTGSTFSTGPQNCFDPFNEDGITTVQCDGLCYANSTSSTFFGQTVATVQRGCVADLSECPPAAMCLDIPLPDGPESGSLCNYCCEGTRCNSIGLQEAAEAETIRSGAFSCWTCSVELVEGMDPAPMSCSSDDFNGEGAVAIPCLTQCVKAKVPSFLGQPASFARLCDPDDMCSLPGLEIECCNGHLCNVGGFTGGK